MTSSQEINNEQIKRLFEQKIEGKKDVYFLISTGSFTDHKLTPIHELDFEYTGAEKFLQMLEEAFDENPYYIGIALYKKAVKKIAKKYFFFKKITLKKEEVKSNPNTLGSLESFGGFEGILQAKVQTQFLSSENESLKKQVEKLEKENEKLKENSKISEKKISELRETSKDKDWKISRLEDDYKRQFDNAKYDHQRELDGIEQRSNKFEKFLTVAGIIAAKTAGLDEGDLRGILGIDEDAKSIENKENKEPVNTEIDIEELENFSGKKAEAKQMIDTINAFLIETLKSNNEQEAYNIIATFTNIINFARNDFNNLKHLHDFVLRASNKNQSVADSVIQQVQNYKQSDNE